nr:helix-turn-helix transcriptional regulator [Kibdelosporangium sp. MJ126-NF4]CEL12906.1 putative DNA-binding protein [Kibdelosporangium sp. MJ126-NF4]CTQ98590.1 putative DNA-binding protein [Kibdelosporangium sp. MJ126-NF4]
MLSQQPSPGAVRFGSRLRHWRQVAGLTQVQLADRLGYHHTYVSKLEAGRRFPPACLVRRADKLLRADGELTLLWQQLHPSAIEPDHPASADPLSTTPLPGAPVPPEHSGESLQGWQARYPVYGMSCPMHGYDGCTTQTDNAPMARFLSESLSASDPNTRTVHGFAALLAGYSQINLERATTAIVDPVERCLHTAADLMRVADQPVANALSNLTARFADLAGWLRVERGQLGIGMAWFHRGLEWGRAAANIPAMCGLYARMSMVARLEDDGHSAIEFARAAQATDPRRRWIVLHGLLHELRGYALLGDRRTFERLTAQALTLAERMDERDRIEAPWLIGPEGQAFISAHLAGGLRDLAERTGDPCCAVRAVEFARHSLVNVLPNMYPSMVLLTLRLADSRACAGEPDAAVATALPVLQDARSAGMTMISRELAGLRSRLGRRWIETEPET